MINKIPVKLPPQLFISKIPASFDENFDHLSINTKIEVEKFEPEPTFENTINKIKDNNLTIITPNDMNLLDIPFNKTSSSTENLKSDLMPRVVLQSPGKPPQFTKHLSSIQSKVNTKLQIRKWWVPLRSVLYLSFFDQNFINISQSIAPDIQQRKHSK